MPSRDPKDLHPELRERWEWMQEEWVRRYPDGPQPFLTCTYRPASEQQALKDEGKSMAGPMESLHNYYPALAFDVAMRKQNNGISWDFPLYQKWGELAEEIGLEWGGRWPNLVDGPHVQWPTTWKVAQTGVLPELDPLPSDGHAGHESPLIEADTLHVMRGGSEIGIYPLDPERPARRVGRKLYANVGEATKDNS